MQNRFPWKLYRRLLATQAVLVIAALVVSSMAARRLFERAFRDQLQSQLRGTLLVLERELPSPAASASQWQEWCHTHSPEHLHRLTAVDFHGTVLCDSESSPSRLENHADRPEIAQALSPGSGGFGQSERYSSSLGQSMFYDAKAIPDRKLVLRAAVPLDRLQRTLRIFDTSLAGGLALLLVGLAVFAAWSARRMLAPLGYLIGRSRQLSTKEGQGIPGGGDLSELESSLDSIERDLEQKGERLTREREGLATLLGAMSDAVLAIDPQEKRLFLNDRFGALFGQAGPDMHLWEILREPEILEAFRECIRSGTTRSLLATALDTRQGPKYFSISVAPLRRESVYGAIGVFHDVTVLKQSEQIRIDFVANVSHELRTPLTTIRGYADTLLGDVRKGHPAEPQFLESIVRSSERLSRLINDLLDLSRLESTAGNDAAIHKEALDTARLTARLLADLQPIFDKKKQKLCADIQAVTVCADPGRAEQVLMNLLQNAHQYTPEGTTVTVRWGHGPSGETWLEVEDNGPGIPREHLDRLFERFYRLDKSRSRDLGGTGLGLAIVKHILQSHGGSVEVESVLGRGSLFRCRFPGRFPAGEGRPPSTSSSQVSGATQ